LEVAAAEAEAEKRQKIVISWHPDVWLMETCAGRPFRTHRSYSDMKSAERLLDLLPSRTTAAHEGPTLGRGVRAGWLECR
jgi:hypothetical protein